MNIKKQIKTGISQNQIDFLRKHRYHHHMVTFSRFLILCLFLTAWEFASRSHLIDPFFFSSPSLILSCIAAMVKNCVEWSGLSYQEKHVSGQTGLVLALAFLFVDRKNTRLNSSH